VGCAVFADPETSNLFLTEDEKQIVRDNLPETAPSMKAKTPNLQGKIKDLFRDPMLISFTLLWVTHGISGWSISLVLPTVIYELG
jgi:hypothetical protein